jgi:hypothetical protein
VTACKLEVKNVSELKSMHKFLRSVVRMPFLVVGTQFYEAEFTRHRFGVVPSDLKTEPFISPGFLQAIYEKKTFIGRSSFR